MSSACPISRFLNSVLPAVVICSTLQVITATESTGEPQSELRMPRTEWPYWGGPLDHRGAIDYADGLVDSMEDARLLWESEDVMSVTYRQGKVNTSGCCSPIWWNGRVYLYYHGHSEDRVQLADFGGDEAAVAKRLKGQNHSGFNHKDGRKLPVRWSEAWTKLHALNIYRDDILVCLDAETGRILWRRSFPSYYLGDRGGWHNNPCIAEGRLYFHSIDHLGIFCLDAMTGEVLWRRDDPRIAGGELAVRRCLRAGVVGSGSQKNRIDHTAVIDGHLVCGAGIFDAKTGKLLRAEGISKPLRWVHGDQEFVFDRHNGRMLNIRSGETLWTVGRFLRKQVSSAISGDLLFHDEDGGFALYRMGLDGVEQLWKLDADYGGMLTSPVINGNAIHMATIRLKGKFQRGKKGGGFDNKAYMVVDLQSGQILYTKVPHSQFNEIITDVGTGVSSNGWVIGQGTFDGKFSMSRMAADGKSLDARIASLPVMNCKSPSPIMVDGRLISRARPGLVCIDLRKNPPAQPPALAGDPAAASLPGPVQALGSAYRSERRAGIAALMGMEQLDTTLVHALVRLLATGNHTSQRAAARALHGLGNKAAGGSGALVDHMKTQGSALPASRLRLVVSSLHAIDSKTAAEQVKQLADKMLSDKDQAGMARLAKALADSPTLAEALTGELVRMLAADDLQVIDAVGSALAHITPAKAASHAPEILNALQRCKERLPAHLLRAIVNLAPAASDEMAEAFITHCSARIRTNHGEACKSVMNSFPKDMLERFAPKKKGAKRK